MRTLFLVTLLLALYGTAVCSEDASEYPEEPEDAYGGGETYGGGEGGEGGGEDGAEQPPPQGESTELTTVDDFDQFIDDADASVIAAFKVVDMPDPEALMPEGWDADEDGEWEAPVIETPALTSFKKITSDVSGYRYAWTSSPEVLAKLKQKSSVGLYLYRSPKFVSTEHGDRPRDRFPSDKLSESAVSNWLAAKAQPLVGKYDFNTKLRYKSATLVVFINLDFDGNAKGVAYVLKRARKVAAKFKGKLAFAVADVRDQQYDLADYGLKASTAMKSDVLMGIRSDDSYDASFYTGEAAFSASTLEAFATKYLAGELTKHVRPEPEPVEEPAGEPSDDDLLDDDAGPGEHPDDDFD